MNLSIPDAAADLGVSETRLRRAVTESAIPTLFEFRKTRTGVRKTTVLAPNVIALLRARFEPPVDCASEATPSQAYMPLATADCCDTANSEAETSEMPSIAPDAVPIITPPTVPYSQFNALLYQHNVLKQELERITEYLDGCDRLLGEMVNSIAALDERTRMFESYAARAGRSAGSVAGAVLSVTARFRNALSARRSDAISARQPTDIQFAGALAGR